PTAAPGSRTRCKRWRAISSPPLCLGSRRPDIGSSCTSMTRSSPRCPTASAAPRSSCRSSPLRPRGPRACRSRPRFVRGRGSARSPSRNRRSARSRRAATELDEPSCPAAPVMAQRAATNATLEPEILQQNSQGAPPWVEAPASEPQPAPQIEGREPRDRVDPTRGGNGDARDLPHVNGGPPIALAATPQSFTNKSGNGAQWSGGSKSEAERDTYSEEHAGKPFNDAFLLRQGYRLAHVFDYTLADGTLLYQQNRYELKNGIAPTQEKPRKRFLPHRIVNGKDVLGAGDRLVPYNWPAIMRAGPGSTVLWSEGELKAKVLIDKGLLATTLLSHKVTPECVAALTGNHVIILADHDQQGEKLAAAAQKELAPVAASTRIVPAAHLWKYLPGQPEPKPHDDVWNWVVEHGGDPAKLLNICR